MLTKHNKVLAAASLALLATLAQAQSSNSSSSPPPASMAAYQEAGLQVEAEITDNGQKASAKARIAVPGRLAFTQGDRRYTLQFDPAPTGNVRVSYVAEPQRGVGSEKQLVGSSEGSLIAEIGKKAAVEFSSGFKLNLQLSR
ncbi:hypothetical protein [Pelomonas sp. SE-A7]|uniref:hypothetical protein n=1 Tax=Pelomonas sp. SE-A7 TaxID=3054953 RepID=UPI00259C6E37|nr:hypothetical protein [Pelomonas sp. SE-A7]MDM4766593.1 hypothetical protein [Pelomonas sp. SE-A7]